MKNTLRSIFMVMAASVCVMAQSAVSGIVADPTGSTIPGATVTMTNTDTDAVRTVNTGSEGEYVFTNLAIGPYKLQATKSGFSTYNQTGIVLQVGTNPQISIVMQIGAVSDQVTVQADAAMVETQTTSVGQVIDQQRVIDLPLNGRNVAQLITLSGASVQNTGGGLASNLNYPTASSFSIAGSQGNETNYFLDGGNHIDPRTNVGLPLPFPDSLQEFKVESSTLPANYGNHPGGAVNVVTKSGTNAFHGDAFYFIRNYAFNARNVYASARDSLKRNQYGGTLGGRLVKNKLFFFAGFQHSSEHTAPATNQAFVPTAAVLQGDFRAILAPPCQKTQVNLNAASGAVNNVLPLSALNSVALNYMKLLPVATDVCGKILYGVPSINREYQGVTRLDWQRTQNDTIFIRYFIADYEQQAYYDKTNILTAGSAGLLDRVQSVTIGDTYLINSTTVNTFRASYSRSAVQRVDAAGLPTIRDLGSNVDTPIPNYIGQNFGATGYFTSGAIPGWVYGNIYSLTNDIAMSKGSHQLTFGGNWIHVAMNGNGPFQQNPRFTFNGSITGNALADLITGNAASILQGNGQVARDAANIPSIYAQDNWKVARNLQINMGIRWDPFIPQHQLYNYASQFDTAKFYSGQVSTVFHNAPPGLTFPGDAGFPGQSVTSPRWFDFAPRIGFVFDPRGRGKETVRGGYGIYYDSSYLWNTLHVPLNPPWGNTLTLPNVNLTNPYANYPGGNPFPTGTPGPNFVFPIDGTYVFEPPNVHATYVQQWNLSLQKQVGGDWLFSATYLGNKTTHQWLGQELNPAVYGQGATTGNQESRRVFIRANPATGKYFGSVGMIDDNGNASYNGLLLVANHRFTHEFSILSNYTWSHCLNQGEAGQDIVNAYQNPNNRRAEWGNCANDRRQVFNTSAVVQSPEFTGKALRLLLSGWQFSPIFTASTGAPLTVTDGTDISLTALGLDRPNVVGDANLSNPTHGQWFNTAAFQRQLAGTFGNAGRSVITGPARWNIDAAISRNFRIREGIRLNLRWEAFNMLNHANFGNPGTNLNSGTTFGIISTASDPRIMQGAVKLVF